MAQELGISKQKANNMINVIKFMIENDDLDKKHWSYYEEYLKNAGIKKYRETNADIDETIANAIKTGEVVDSKDMRKLGEIAKIGDRQSKKVMQKIADGEIDLYEGYAQIQDSGKLDDVVKKLKTFRNYINDDSIKKQIKVSDDTYKNAQFEIKKIIKRLQEFESKN